MKRSPLATLLALSLLLLGTAPASAQLFRAYLASDGSDANPCTLALPCRLLPAAIVAVANGGQIWMLDSANYNTATVDVNKSVTILAVPGAVGSVVVTAGPALNIATDGVMVALRNLVITPLPAAVGAGIVMSAGQRLTVEECLVSGLSGHGISVSADAQVSITDSTIRNNLQLGIGLAAGARAVITRTTVSDNGSYGVYAFGGLGGSTTAADVASSTINRNAAGVYAYSNVAAANVRVSVHGSQVVDNDQGILSQSTAGASVDVSASGNIVSNNVQYGLSASGAGARMWASGNTVFRNGTGMNQASSATFDSASDNAVRYNSTANQTGTITAVPKS